MFTCGPAFFAAGTSYGPTDNPYYVDVTVPSGKTASDLTNFPVMIDMANLPSSFWSHVSSSGREIRAKTTSGTSLAFDVAKFDKAGNTGWMFVKVPTLAAASSNVIRIYYGASGLSALAVTDTYGRNAVWTDYHRVTIFSQPGVDRSGHSYGAYTFMQPGKSFSATTVKSSFGFSVEAQGVEWDGTNYYVTDTTSLYKYDSSWNLVSSVANIYTNVPTANHLGDPCIVSGELLIPADNWNGATGTGDQLIRVRPSDLAVLGLINVTGLGRPVAAIALNPDDGYIWVADYTDGTSLMRMTTAGVLVDTITLSVALDTLQGITFLGGYAYVSNGGGRTFEIGQDGTVRRVVYDPPTTIVGEGICTKDSGLILLSGSGTSSARSLTWTSDPTGAATDWLNLNGDGGHARQFGVTKFTQWSVGISGMINAKTSARGVVSYGDPTGALNTVRATLGWDNGTDRWGVWNSTDLWLDSNVAPVLSTVYRLNATHDGTTQRKVYVNGTGFTDNGVVQKPSNVGTAVFLGCSDSAENNPTSGRFNFFYLRQGVLSADWIAAESSSWLTPSSFYSVGTEQAA
jgi:hypothetical protein